MKLLYTKLATAAIATTDTTNRIGIQIGDRTHVHDHEIRFVNFKITNTIKTIDDELIPDFA